MAPVMALRLVFVKLRTKSGMARALGSQHPSPPLVISSCAIWSECGGRVLVLKAVLRKLVMMFFMAIVSGPMRGGVCLRLWRNQ